MSQQIFQVQKIPIGNNTLFIEAQWTVEKTPQLHAIGISHNLSATVFIYLDELEETVKQLTQLLQDAQIQTQVKRRNL